MYILLASIDCAVCINAFLYHRYTFKKIMMVTIMNLLFSICGFILPFTLKEYMNPDVMKAITYVSLICLGIYYYYYYYDTKRDCLKLNSLIMIALYLSIDDFVLAFSSYYYLSNIIGWYLISYTLCILISYIMYKCLKESTTDLVLMFQCLLYFIMVFFVA